MASIGRRAFVAGALSSPLALGGSQARDPVFIADMHFHSFFGDSKYHSRPVSKALAAGNATLVAWSLSGDLLWYDFKAFKPKSAPAPGETFGWVQRELGRIKGHIAVERLKTLRSASDVDRARRGEPHIVLAVEGANFIEKDPRRVKAVYDLGVRHLQLVHYVGNTIGDNQTSTAEYGGLTDLGKQVVRECNRLGILIDLAHCSEATVRDVLAQSRAPVVWSHGSVTKAPLAPPTALVWRRRQLSLATAGEIARKGGVVGLWALAPDVGKTVEAYGDRIMELAGWLGEDHVAFGTDINGLGTFGVVSGYAELRRVVEYWQRQNVAEALIEKIAFGNYARVLKAALSPIRQ